MSWALIKEKYKLKSFEKEFDEISHSSMANKFVKSFSQNRDDERLFFWLIGLE